MDDGLPVDESWEIHPSLIKPVGKEIGHGSFGKVYVADYLGTEVAVKSMAPQEDDEPLPPLYIKREISILKACRHPNIVTFMGIVRKDGAPEHECDIVMELCSKGDLRSFLKKPDNEISWRRRITMAIDIAKAMAYLHSKKIVFRDLKCKNFLLDFHSRVKVCDFGFARTHTEHSRPRTMCGTDGFMAPELILGMDYDEKVDVFSYGMVLFELITRQRVDKAIPRGPMDFFGVVESKVRGSGILPADSPEKLVSIAFHCVQYEAKDRPDFTQILVSLTELLASMPQRSRTKAIAAKKESTVADPAKLEPHKKTPEKSKDAPPSKEDKVAALRVKKEFRSSREGLPKDGGGPSPRDPMSPREIEEQVAEATANATAPFSLDLAKVANATENASNNGAVKLRKSPRRTALLSHEIFSTQSNGEK